MCRRRVGVSRLDLPVATKDARGACPRHHSQPSKTLHQHNVSLQMSLVAGPGRGGRGGAKLPEEIQLAVEAHTKYIQSLDTVRSFRR